MSNVDFGRYSDDYAAARKGPPASFYDRLDAKITIRGSRSLDLATGPGIVALELAARGSAVTGIDISSEQIAAAERVSKDRGLADVTTFAVGRAEETRLEAGAFDLVTAAQCWHWFDHDAAMAEIRRVLRPGGLLAIIDYPYLAAQSSVARESEALILKFNPSWTMAGSTGAYPEEIDDVIRGGFAFVEAFCYDHDEEFSHALWRARMKTCNGVGSGSLSPAEVQSFDEALGRMLSEKFPDPLKVRHRVWCVVAKKP